MLKEFFAGKTPARLLMIAAIVLLLVSQFFLYLDDPATGQLFVDADFNTAGFYSIPPTGTGWELHPHAYVILVVLAFAYLRDDILEMRWFDRAGWWLTVVLFIAATIPGAYLRATGGGMGGIAVLMAIIAAILHMRERRATRTP